MDSAKGTGGVKVSLITPSYRPDSVSCELLCQSVERFVDPQIEHVLVVPSRDKKVFKKLAGQRARILVAEDLLPWWVRHVPLSNRWWLTPVSLPVRGWIIQQIIKLSIAKHIESDVLVFADSELVFVRPYGMSHIVQDGRVRLYCVPGGGDLPSHHRWHIQAAKLLGLDHKRYFGKDYIGPLVSWRRDTLLKLYSHLEKQCISASGGWRGRLLRSLHLSEYILYGLFVDEVCTDQCKHFHDNKEICHVAWANSIKNNEGLRHFFNNILPQHVAVLIQSNLDIDVESYRSFIDNYIDNYTQL